MRAWGLRGAGDARQHVVALPCHAMPCHAMQRHAMPCSAVPCQAMPCHVHSGPTMSCHMATSSPLVMFLQMWGISANAGSILYYTSPLATVMKVGFGSCRRRMRPVDWRHSM